MKAFRTPALALLLTLAACGFHPLYGGGAGEGTPVAEALQNVSIASIPNREGQVLRNQLIDRFYTHGRPDHPIAVLNVKLRKTEVDLGIQKDATATRRQIEVWADYSLTDMAKKDLFKGVAHSVVSYNKLAAQYGNVAAQRNAQERAVKEVGEQIVNRVSLYYSQGDQAEP